MDSPRHVRPEDIILDPAAYRPIRAERRKEILKIKEHRRVTVGPFAMFYFETFETMRHQVQEMVYTERGGEAQLAEELEAYNPLVPDGHELVATVMFEITDPERRDRALQSLVGVEKAMALVVDGEEIPGQAESQAEPDRGGPPRTGSVHFVHFRFTSEQIAAFRKDGAKVALQIMHPAYSHVAILPEATRKALALDFS